MGHVRKDTLVSSVEWAKHLRPFEKRRQAKKERLAAKKALVFDQGEGDRLAEQSGAATRAKRPTSGFVGPSALLPMNQGRIRIP